MPNGFQLAIVLPAGEPSDLLWLHGIQPALREMELSGARLPTRITTPAEREVLRQQVLAADALLVELTAGNPVVLYALAVAEAAAKPVIAVARHAELIPWQFSRPVLVHADHPASLRTQLIQRLGELLPAAAQTPATPPSPAPTPDRERFLTLFGDLLQQHGHVHRGDIRCEDAKTFLLVEQDMELALVEALSRRARELGLRLKLL